MTHSFDKTTIVVWVLLMALTAVSWTLGHDEPQATLVTPQAGATVGIIVLTLFKVRLILMHFMEVRHAPIALKLVCEGWLLLVGGLLVLLYFFGASLA